MSRWVVAVVATFRRPREIARLIASLSGVDEIVVCDNSADPEVRAAVEAASIPSHYLAPESNLGCGGGLRLAEEHAWKVAGERLSHLLVLDDDAVLHSNTVEGLESALHEHHAVVAYPLILGSDGKVGWTPGLRDRAKHRLGKVARPLEEYRALVGTPVPDFDWAQGICLLARRDAVGTAGFHRSDFWVRGEDLDFSLRLTAQGRGVFVTSVTADHLPPAAATPSAGDRAEYLRHAAMVQNIAYLGLRQPHGYRIASSIPGAIRRFIATWGIGSSIDAGRALWRGAVRAEPAGRGHGDTFRHRFDELLRR